MAITISRVSDELYAAMATPPHSKNKWETSDPVGLRKLISDLQNQGCHPTDISDALYELDPNWLEKLD